MIQKFPFKISAERGDTAIITNPEMEYTILMYWHLLIIHPLIGVKSTQKMKISKSTETAV